jgi:folate-binding protein YgfZ
MSDNPQVSPQSFFRLGFGVLAVSGPDAVKFLHAQCMSDVAALAPGHWQWSGWLTPKGRVIALFALLKLDEQTAWLVLPDADAAALAAQLKRFVFRSKLAIAVRDDLVVAGAFLRPNNAEGARLVATDAGSVELDVGGDGGPRCLRIATTPAPEDATALTRWMRFDLEHGLPRLPTSQAEQWTPQMLSLDRLRAFSVKKGCYPGQEIVARTHFLGQAKRGLALLESEKLAEPGAEVRAGEQAIGTLVSRADDLALAILSLGHGAALCVAGVPVRERPLLDGLAR